MSFAVSRVFVTSFVQVSYKFRTSFAIPRTRRISAADGHVFRREATTLGEFLSLLDKKTAQNKTKSDSNFANALPVPRSIPLIGFRPSPTVSPWPAVVVSWFRCFAVAAPSYLAARPSAAARIGWSRLATQLQKPVTTTRGRQLQMSVTHGLGRQLQKP